MLIELHERLMDGDTIRPITVCFSGSYRIRENLGSSTIMFYGSGEQEVSESRAEIVRKIEEWEKRRHGSLNEKPEADPPARPEWELIMCELIDAVGNRLYWGSEPEIDSRLKRAVSAAREFVRP